MTFITDHSFPLKHGPKMLPTASLITEPFNELQYVGGSDFPSNQNPDTVTYLRTGKQTD
jgi:hypothetical protein